MTSRWINVTIERELGGHAASGMWGRLPFARVFGPPPHASPGKLPWYGGFTAIVVQGAPPPTDVSALALTTAPSSSVINPSQGEPVELRWDGDALHIVFLRAQVSVGWAFELNCDVISPLAVHDRGVFAFRFGIPYPYIRVHAGFSEYLSYLDCKGFKAQLAGVHPLPAILDQWVAVHDAHDFRRPPAILRRSHAALLTPGAKEPQNGVEFERVLRFSTADVVGAKEDETYYRLTTSAGAPRWRRTDSSGVEAPTLWPLGLTPNHPGNRDLVDREEIGAWAARTRPPVPRWTLDVHWRTTETAPAPEGPRPLTTWNSLTTPHHQALGLVRAASGGSVIPRFREEPGHQSWQSVYRVRPRPGSHGGFECDRFRLAVVEAPIDVQVELPGLRDHDGAPIARRLRLEPSAKTPVPVEAAPDLDDADRHQIALPLRDVSVVTTPTMTRIGGLDLGLGSAPTAPGKLPAGAVMASVAGLLSTERTPGRATGPLRLHARGVGFAVASVSPADQDLTEAEARSPLGRTGLVFELTSTPAATISPEIHHVLTAAEHVGANRDHSLSLSLVPYQGAAAATDGSRRVVVIDDQPFQVACVDLDRASLRGEWASDHPEGASWSLTDGGRPGVLRLPPQAVGEEMIKAYDGVPYTPDPARPLMRKLSPPARLAVERRETPTSASEPPWNVRRLFGWPRRRMPGARVYHAEFELLYGLTTSLDGDLRFVELGAAIGEPRLADEPRGRGDVEFLAGTRRGVELMESRLAYLYAAPSDRPYQAAVIESGLVFRLRPQREVAHPIDPSTDDEVLGQRYVPPARGGLAGGVDWGFQSRNIYEEVLGSSSTGGRLVAPALTALGGYGFQKAGFANDKSRIYSDTALGRTFFYSLERIGRIGVLWHTAKHVITYERTTAASDQFPDRGTATESVWGKRPVIRKVAEYIELLQEQRSYPEGGAPPASNGFVLGARFADRVIRVDSTWGRDVPGGWVVPLFRADAPAAAYPRPEIRIQLATAGEPAWARIANPEDLVFYTSTDRHHDANPDSWPPVVNVDFPIGDLPTVDARVPAPAADTLLPDAPALEPGYERFTLRLEEIGARVNLTAGRTSSAVEATLRNVSLARRGLEQVSVQGADQWLAARGAVASYQSAVESGVALATQVGADLSAEWAAFQDRIEAAQTAAAAGLQHLPDLLAHLRAQQTDYLATWPRDLAGVVADTRNRIGEIVAGGAAHAETAVTTVLNELGHRLAAVQLVTARVGERLRLGAVRLRQLVTELRDTLTDGRTRIILARDHAVVLFAEVTSLVTRFTSRIQHAADEAEQVGGAALRQARNRLLALLPGRLPAANQALEVWAAQLDVDGLCAEIEAIPAALPAAIAELDDLASAVTTGSDAVTTALHELLAVEDNPLARQALQDFAVFQARLERKVTDLRGAVETKVRQELGKLDEKAARLRRALGDPRTVAQEVATEAGHWLSLASRISALAHVHPTLVDAGRAFAASAVARLADQLADHRGHIEGAISSIVEQAPAQARSLGDRTMRLVRAFGDAPVATGLTLSRERLAYCFHEMADLASGVRALSPRVTFMPATALVNRVGREISGLDLRTVGLRLPTFAIDHRIIPDLRQQLDLARMFPDFAGLKLAGLFSGLKFPNLAGDRVQIRHGVDAARRTAWVRADVDVPIPSATVFELGPFAVRLSGARFEAHSHISVDPALGTRRSTHASIHSDWRFEISGQLVAALERARLELDDAGKLRFRVSPTAIRVADALRMLSKLLQSAPSGSGSGLSIAPVIGPSGLPIGVRAAINLALPTIQTGAFSISNLSLATYFELRAGGPSGFELAAGLGLSDPDRPFNLSVLFLGGGGWLTTRVRYSPFGGSSPVADVSIGLAAGASLPFDIGIAKGGVWLLLSVGVRWSLGGHGNLEITLALSLRGEVVLLGIVSVSLYLRLEARYLPGDSGLQCTGRLSLTIKIGWFFKISVEQQVTFRLAGGGGASAIHAATTHDVVDAYADAYEPDA